jgi:excisionase family DNA binding protein
MTTDTSAAPKVMTVAAAAVVLQVSEQTVRRMIRDGILSAVRARTALRVPIAEVDALAQGASA